MQKVVPRFRSQQFFKQDMRRTVLCKFIEICMETPCRCPSGWAPTWRPETGRKICHWVLLQKREFISQGTQEHQNNAFSNTWIVQIAKFPEISHLFNKHESFLCRVKQKLRNSSEVYRKIKDPFWAKICVNSSFQLLLYNMKVTSQENQ